jgi:hypothetical protein
MLILQKTATEILGIFGRQVAVFCSDPSQTPSGNFGLLVYAGGCCRFRRITA